MPHVGEEPLAETAFSLVLPLLTNEALRQIYNSLLGAPFTRFRWRCGHALGRGIGAAVHHLLALSAFAWAEKAYNI